MHVHDIRRQNLRTLIEQWGGPTALAIRLGFTTGSGLNDKNPGVYVRTHDGFTAGMYFNSYARMTRYAGFTWTQAHVWGDYSLTAALATGYNGPVSPMVLPSVRLGPARLTVAPGIGPVHNALHLSVEWQIP